MNEKPYSITIVHMGDSITFGQYIDPKLCWTSLVLERLRELYLNTPIDINSLNCGVSGDTTRMGLERYPADVQNANPDILTLQFGLNDCNCWETDRGLPRVSKAGFRANLVEMIVRARQFGAIRIILANNHTTLRENTMLSGERFEDANACYSEISYKVAIETNIDFCDIRKAFSTYTTDELKKLLRPYPDLLHLSANGNELYAETIWPFIEDAVEDVIQKKEMSGV
jgi:lysophospholipase L1-like esterase